MEDNDNDEALLWLSLEGEKQKQREDFFLSIKNGGQKN
jgi:hypothetical protein